MMQNAERLMKLGGVNKKGRKSLALREVKMAKKFEKVANGGDTQKLMIVSKSFVIQRQDTDHY